MIELKVLSAINKKFGARASFLMGDESSDLIPVIPTGSFKLDVALGVGGVPRGRICEVYGPESSGKSTLCLHIISECQKMGGVAAFVDVEHALDPYWINTCGVDISELVASQPDTGEQALDIVEMYVRSGEIDVVVVDSVAALAPKAEIEGEMGDAHMALVARLMSQAMRKLTHVVSQSKTSVIFTNQLRDKINATGWGDPSETTGGKALRYYAAIRIDLRRTEQIKEKDETVGNKVKATIRKNKVSPPFKVTELEIRYDEGISQLSELIDYGITLGIIEKGGAWFTINDTKVQGMPGIRNLLKEDKAILQSIEDKVRIHLGMPIRRF